MKRKRYIVVLAIVFLAALAGLAVWYMKTRGPDSEPASFASTAGPHIATVRPVRRTFTLNLPWVGTVETRASVDLTALVAGRIEHIEAKDQSPIKTGDPVMRLGGPQIDTARADLTDKITALKSQIDLARETVERHQKNLASRLVTKDEVAAAEDTLFRLEARLRQARLKLAALENQRNISAPMDGVFTDRQVSLGQHVDAGQRVGEIVDNDRLRIVASLFPPADIDLEGKEATVRAEKDRRLTAVVRCVLPRASASGATTVWIEGPQIDAQLRPGQSVGGTLAVSAGPASLAVPVSAIVYDEQEQAYLFVDKDGTYKRLSIQLGPVQGDWAAVKAGLSPDQWVVTQGAYELFYRQFNQQFKVQD